MSVLNPIQSCFESRNVTALAVHKIILWKSLMDSLALMIEFTGSSHERKETIFNVIRIASECRSAAEFEERVAPLLALQGRPSDITQAVEALELR